MLFYLITLGNYMAINTNYNPSLTVQQFPNFYGGQQDDYLNRARKIIEETGDKIAIAMRNGDNLKEFFFTVIADLSLKRQEIAKDHNTKASHAFGFRRDMDSPGKIAMLLLKPPYEKYNQKILSLIGKYLKLCETTPGQFKTQKFESNYRGQTSTLNVEVLNLKDLSTKGYNKSEQEYLPDYIKNHEHYCKENITGSSASDLREKYLKFKKESLESYNKIIGGFATRALIIECPSPSQLKIDPNSVRELYPKEKADEILGNLKSLYVHVTFRTSVNNQLLPMTRYVTWMYENYDWLHKKTPTEHPIERMKLCSTVLMIHQDEFRIQETLLEIAKIFETVVKWDRNAQSINDLKETMALLMHLATHNIRDRRGTAAENEWLEAAIYHALGLNFKSDKTKSVDLEAFANPFLKDFVTLYKDMTNLSFI